MELVLQVKRPPLLPPKPLVDGGKYSGRKWQTQGIQGANVVSLSGRFIERRPKGFVREVIVDKIRAITGIGYPSSPLKSKTPVFWSADWRTRRALCIGYFSGSSFGPSI